jgi:hypothetical protein
MAKINGFKSEAPVKGFPMLKKGAYVAGIKNVKIDGDAPDQQIVFRVDIIEGEETGYFTKRYNHDRDAGGKYDVKYKGDFKIQIPNGDNAKRQHPEWDLKKLNNTVWAIEQSNPGFHWDGDTDHIGQFKGKTVGINMQYGTYNGVGFTKIGQFCVAEDVRKGLVQPMRDMPDRMGDAPGAQASAPAADPSGFTPVEIDTEELPF